MDLLAFGSIFAVISSIGLNLLYALIVLFVGLKLIKWAVTKLNTSAAFDKLDPSLRGFAASCLKIMLYFLLAMTVVKIIGIDTAGFITVLASCGVAVGLALQGALSNFAGGIMLLFFRPFHVGDFVEAGGHTGTVMEINVFYTILNTLDNRRVTIPNGNLTGAAVVNYSTEGKRRVDFTFGASYSDDIELVKDTIQAVAEAHPLVLKGADAPAPVFVRMSAQKDSALEYTLRVWVNNADYWTVFFDLNEGVKKAFDEKGITIPFPQITVHPGADRMQS